MPTDPSAVQAAVADVNEIPHARQVLLLALVTLAEQREADSESHILRVQNYVLALALALAKQPAFADVLTPAFIDTLYLSVPLYDMGSIGIPDRILLKPGRLTPEELTIMRTHPSIGHAAIERAEKTLGRPSPRLGLVKDLVLCHQEKWDGSGYPEGLSGDAIPISARLMAVADVYDALISRRVYKEGMPHEKAVSIIREGRGSHFDPDMVDAFLELEDEFRAIAARYADTDDDLAAKATQMERLQAPSAP
jgi:putative two-component system response regulator